MANIVHKAWQLLLIAVGCFFLIFGIHLLISAYRVNHPFYFIMTFFASNLIILISGALVAGFVIRLLKSDEKKENTVPTDSEKEG